MSKEVLIKFETEEQASNFMQWLSNSGEQEYFQDADDHDWIDAVNHFSYDYQNNIINGETKE